MVSSVNATLKELAIKSRVKLVKDQGDTANLKIDGADSVIELFHHDTDLPPERPRFDFAAIGGMEAMYIVKDETEANGRLCEVCAAIVLTRAADGDLSNDDLRRLQRWCNNDGVEVRVRKQRSTPLILHGVTLCNDRTGEYLYLVASRSD